MSSGPAAPAADAVRTTGAQVHQLGSAGEPLAALPAPASASVLSCGRHASPTAAQVDGELVGAELGILRDGRLGGHRRAGLEVDDDQRPSGARSGRSARPRATSHPALAIRRRQRSSPSSRPQIGRDSDSGPRRFDQARSSATQLRRRLEPSSPAPAGSGRSATAAGGVCPARKRVHRARDQVRQRRTPSGQAGDKGMDDDALDLLLARFRGARPALEHAAQTRSG